MRRFIGPWALGVLCVAGCGDDGGGADASVIGIPGTYTVSGVIRYEDRAPLQNGADAALGAPQPQVARGVTVALIAEDTSTTLAMAVSGEDGSYSFMFDAVGGDKVHVLASTSSMVPERPVTVRRTDDRIHGFGGETFGAGVITTADVLVTIVSGEAEAFNIFDQMIIGMDRLYAVIADPTPPALDVVWQRGNTNGTFYFDNTIHLLGETADDDGFDDTVMLHELGHYVEDVEGRTDSPGGNHDGSPVDPRLAWSEGWATYWSMAVRDLPIYMDTNAGGGFSQNADTDVTKANLNQNLSQQVSEDMVTEILWDLGDAPASDDDPVAGTHDADILVQAQYLKTAQLRNVGASGVDLVDFLDGWFVKDGLAHCAGVRSIVVTTHTFPYDFAGPGGTCP